MLAPTKVARAAVVALIAVAVWLAFTPRGDAGAARSALAASQYFVLVLDGVEVGVLKSMSSSTVTPPPTPKGSKREQGEALNGELELQFGLGMRAALFEWIGASLQPDSKPRNGAVVSLDFNGKPTTQTEFSDAVLTGLTIPALDGASKAEGFFTLNLAANLRNSAAAAVNTKALGTKPKVWTTSNFRLEIDGIPTKRVMKVDGLSLRAPTSAAGAALSDRSPLKITVSLADIESWQKWQQAAAQGDNVQREGRIVILGPDFKDTLAEIKLHRLGISALRTSGSSSTGPAAKFEAELSYGSLEIVPAAK